jgi:hypothetical protein
MNKFKKVNHAQDDLQRESPDRKLDSETGDVILDKVHSISISGVKVHKGRASLIYRHCASASKV